LSVQLLLLLLGSGLGLRLGLLRLLLRLHLHLVPLAVDVHVHGLTALRRHRGGRGGNDLLLVVLGMGRLPISGHDVGDTVRTLERLLGCGLRLGGLALLRSTLVGKGRGLLHDLVLAVRTQLHEANLLVRLGLLGLLLRLLLLDVLGVLLLTTSGSGGGLSLLLLSGKGSLLLESDRLALRGDRVLRLRVAVLRGRAKLRVTLGSRCSLLLLLLLLEKHLLLQVLGLGLSVRLLLSLRVLLLLLLVVLLLGLSLGLSLRLGLGLGLLLLLLEGLDRSGIREEAGRREDARSREYTARSSTEHHALWVGLASHGELLLLLLLLLLLRNLSRGEAHIGGRRLGILAGGLLGLGRCHLELGRENGRSRLRDLWLRLRLLWSSRLRLGDGGLPEGLRAKEVRAPTAELRVRGRGEGLVGVRGRARRTNRTEVVAHGISRRRRRRIAVNDELNFLEHLGEVHASVVAVVVKPGEVRHWSSSRKLRSVEESRRGEKVRRGGFLRRRVGFVKKSDKALPLHNLENRACVCVCESVCVVWKGYRQT